MAYNPAKAKAANKAQSKRIDENFLKNVDASPNVKLDGMMAKNIKIKYLYEAPSNWNFYDELDDNKKLELIESISENGLMSPIVIWEINKEKVSHLYETHTPQYNMSGFMYMVLAGHNRIDAYNKLYESTKDEKYLSIPAFIFYENELTEHDAKEIIVDTNYVQRVLSTKEKVMSVMYKYAEIERNKTKKGATKNIVAEELGLSPTMVFNYKKLGEIIEPLQNMVYDNKINITSILKISDKSKETQQWIYETYGNNITNKALNKIKQYMKRDDIAKIFEKEMKPKVKTKKVSVEVPEELVDEFKTMFSKWIYEKTKRD